MRYIDPSLIDINTLEDPKGWQAEADKASLAVAAGAKTEGYSQIWRDFKPALEAVIGKKCWYCESINPRSDKNVEHFRPKGKDRGNNPDHLGYPWLAFDYHNYRYSCQYCNQIRIDSASNNRRGGKGEQFPLCCGSPRSIAPGGESFEKPVLIDPCNESDVKLLRYREDGFPCPGDCSNEEDFERVRLTIGLYHLHHSEAVEDRLRLSSDLSALIHDAEYFFIKASSGDNEAIEMLETKLNDLQSKMDIHSEYSLYAECMIYSHRNPELDSYGFRLRDLI